PIRLRPKLLRPGAQVRRRRLRHGHPAPAVGRYPLRVASDDFDGISSRQPGVVVVLSQEERKLLVAEHWLVTGVRYQQPSLFEGGHGDHPSHSDGSTLAIRISPARGKVGNTSAAAFVQCAGGSFVSQISPK